MSIVNTIETIRKWAEDEICSHVTLKLPNDEKSGQTFEYKLVNPSAFSLYVPAKDRVPPNTIAPIPSLCVQLLNGKDELISGKGIMKIRFAFSAWDTGLHGQDIFLPNNTTPQTYTQWNTDQAKDYFKRRSDGWQDVWNFVDTALRIIENAEYIEGYRIIKEDGIEYGPYEEDEAIPDFYPYWFAWVTFSIQYGITRKPSYLDKL